MLGSVLRLVFIASLLAITVRVALPQSETIWTVYDTPGDLVRLALGLGVCIWVAVQLFWAPKDRNAYQTWVYFGLGGDAVRADLPDCDLVTLGRYGRLGHKRSYNKDVLRDGLQTDADG